VQKIVAETGLKVDVSGGIRTSEDLVLALASGARKVVIGSAAVERPEMVREWIARFGSDAVIVGLDVLNGEVRIKGWQEGSSLTIAQVLERFGNSGLRWLMSTDIACDGMLQGASVEMYRALRREYPELSLIASGGVTNADDVRALAEAGVQEVIVGKALYAGTLRPEEAQGYVW
jgi:phosphoribosylformimino-5-aminoimidazole carboxamide ribotide isomerase